MMRPQRSKRTALDGYLERLARSRNPNERKSIIVGRDLESGSPILLSTDLLFEHMHIVGGSGTGKTTLGLITDLIQMIRRDDGPVVVIDCKGDMALFNTARIEAERNGRTFKWFTNRPFRSTYIFNPFEDSVQRRMTPMEIVSFIMQSLNLHHGDDYGRAWFSMVSQIQSKRAVQFDPKTHRQWDAAGSVFPRGPVESFRELHELLRQASQSYLEEFKMGQHLSFLVENLAEFEQLNLVQRDTPAIKNAIQMSEVIRNKEVVYFFLVGATDLVTVAEIGRLAMFALLNAAMAHKDATGRAPRIYCICDEAQTLIAKNIENVLAQARSYGLALILAHQSMSQLNPPGGVDLRELVMSCTCVKQFFSARDPWLTEYLSQMSGQTKYFSASYENHLAHFQAGNAGTRSIPFSLKNVTPIVNIQEAVGPRLMPHDIQEISRQENTCIFGVDHGKGLSQFHGLFPMRVDWPLTKDEYDRRMNGIAWPGMTGNTLEIIPPWPQPNANTIVTTTHPGLTPSPTNPTVPDKIRRMREQLEADEE